MELFEQEKKIAPESSRILRAREKLKKQWEKEDQLITPSALAETVQKIHEWIAQNSTDRVTVLGKEIRLFDQNTNVASVSQRVQKIVQELSRNSPRNP